MAMSLGHSPLASLLERLVVFRGRAGNAAFTWYDGTQMTQTQLKILSVIGLIWFWNHCGTSNSGFSGFSGFFKALTEMERGRRI